MMMTEPFSGGDGAAAHVALGVSGGIGAYKAASMVRALRTAGAAVTVLMTANAAHFITPLTLQALSGNRVLLNQFDGVNREWDVEHVSLSKLASCLLVAPATANIIGKFANGIADDFLSTFYTAYNGPVILAPAMNTVMYEHPAVRHNLDVLRHRGVEIIEPESGFLACGDTGTGRLADTEAIVRKVLDTVSAEELELLRGVRVTVTAGPTREAIDAVRFLTNHSSGKMGYALARQSARMGADVTLISGPVSLAPPAGVRVVKVVSSAEMHGEVMKALPQTRMLLMAAAPADYRPQSAAAGKIHKSEGPMRLDLLRTADILLDAGMQKNDQILIGFAAETEETFEAAAMDKLRRKDLDFIVANRVGQPGSGFGTDENAGVLLGRDGSRTELPLMSKDRMALAILRRAGAALHDREKGQ